jgi:murein DD-endopeptidase MepM/ murein hydrolase activator NlpD
VKKALSGTEDNTSLHPALDTTDVLYSDTVDIFFQRHYSEDLDESQIEIYDDSKVEELFFLNEADRIAWEKEIEALEKAEADSFPDLPTENEVDEEGEEGEEGEESDSIITATYVIANQDEWIKIDSLFKIFSPYNVNPYHFDPNQIKDTVTFKMYDVNRSWSMPLTGTHYVTSKFGPRGSSYHYGTDIDLDIGDTIRSAFDGIVRMSKYNPGGYGNYVLVRHYNGTETIYGHMSERLVIVGQEVKAGQIIGLGGNTGRSSGPHLHFEIRYRGIAMNPQLFFNFSERKIISDVIKLAPSNFRKVKVAVVQKKKVYYKVKRGDTLYGIARKYGVKPSTICKLNRISTRTTLKAGQTLRVK